MPKPRSFAGAALVVGSITGLAFGIFWSWGFAVAMQESLGKVLPFGLIAGLLFGLFFGPLTVFFIKGETATVEVRDASDFVSRLNAATAKLGYDPVTQAEDFFSYKPSLRAGVAAGWISVRLHEGQAFIVGPKTYLKKLLSRLAGD